MVYLKARGRGVGEKEEFTKRYTDGSVALLTCRYFGIDKVIEAEQDGKLKELEGASVFAYSRTDSLPPEQKMELMDRSNELELSGDIAVPATSADSRFAAWDLFDVKSVSPVKKK